MESGSDDWAGILAGADDTGAYVTQRIGVGLAGSASTHVSPR